MWVPSTPIILALTITTAQAVYDVGEGEEQLNCTELIENYLSGKWASGYNTTANYESYICVDDEGMFRQYTTISSSPDFICAAEDLADYTNVGSIADGRDEVSIIQLWSIQVWNIQVVTLKGIL